MDVGEPTGFFATQYVLTGSAKFQFGRNEVLTSRGLGTVICPNISLRIDVSASAGVLGARGFLRGSRKTSGSLNWLCYFQATRIQSSHESSGRGYGEPFSASSVPPL